METKGRKARKSCDTPHRSPQGTTGTAQASPVRSEGRPWSAVRVTATQDAQFLEEDPQYTPLRREPANRFDCGRFLKEVGIGHVFEKVGRSGLC